MIKSMTAYATAEKTDGPVSVNIEIRTYNSRYLDVILRTPVELSPLEEKIKEMLSRIIARGRVEVKIQLKSEDEEMTLFEIDEIRANAYYDVLSRLNKKFNLSSEISLAHLLGAGSIIKPAERESSTDQYWPVIRDCLAKALADLDAMRQQEGNYMAQDFLQRLATIEIGFSRADEKAQGLLHFYQERLKGRIASLTNGMVEIDPSRIAQESAILADKSDISEELVRAKSHIVQFREVMQSEEPSGRKLNFLLQEFNREFNTMGSKAQSAEISHIIVDLKSELEKIREQVQNVE